MPSPTRLTGCLRFLQAGLLNHLQTGDLLPSQRYLVEAMVAPVPKMFRGQILELGAGTGSLTLRLAARCPQATIRSCEINPVLAEHARQNLARAAVSSRVMVLAMPAQQLLSEICAHPGERPAFIISGLSLGNLRKKVVLSLLDGIRRALPKRGMYIQFQHLLWDRRHVRAIFSRVRTVSVLLNLPPAFVYYARR